MRLRVISSSPGCVGSSLLSRGIAPLLTRVSVRCLLLLQLALGRFLTVVRGRDRAGPGPRCLCRRLRVLAAEREAALLTSASVSCVGSPGHWFVAAELWQRAALSGLFFGKARTCIPSKSHKGKHRITLKHNMKVLFFLNEKGGSQAQTPYLSRVLRVFRNGRARGQDTSLARMGI